MLFVTEASETFQKMPKVTTFAVIGALRAKIRFGCIVRAYPGSEFVAANTLAEKKKWEPNKINFSQGFSKKVVSTSCFVFFKLFAYWGDFCCLLITFANSLDSDQAGQNVGPDLDPNF